jgi:hypothetical protein
MNTQAANFRNLNSLSILNTITGLFYTILHLFEQPFGLIWMERKEQLAPGWCCRSAEIRESLSPGSI